MRDVIVFAALLAAGIYNAVTGWPEVAFALIAAAFFYGFAVASAGDAK